MSPQPPPATAKAFPRSPARWQRWLPSALIVLFAVVAALPLFSQPGFLLTRGGGDSPFLLLRLHQLLAALQAGEFPARWMPDAAYGYGFPFFSYYAALPYYLAALLKWYGFTYVGALKLTQLGALLAAAAGAYAWIRALPPAGPNRALAVLAAAAYTFAPFHLANLYVRGDSLSELWAMAFFPWLLWALQRCLAAPTLGRAFAAALLAGGLTFTHNISALNFMPFAGLYVLLMGWRAWRAAPSTSAASVTHARPIGITLLALAWGLGLAAFFWLPALAEAPAVQIGDVVAGYFFYGNHFRAADLLQLTLFYNAEVVPETPTPFAMGLVQALLGALGAVAWLWRAARLRRWSAADTFLLLGLLLSTWMITPASAWAWANLPLVAFTQFPWRFLSIQALFVAVITAQLASDRLPHTARWAMAAVVSLALAWFSLGALRPDFVPVRDDQVTAGKLQLLEYFTANIGSTIGYEYLPRDVAVRPFASERLLGRAPVLKALQGAATGAQLSQRGSRQWWEIEAQSAATIALPTYYWPGWAARVDGQPVSVRAAPGLGWIALDVPAGVHTVEISLGRTPLRAAAEGLSALLLVLPLAALVLRQRTALGRAVVRPATLAGVVLISVFGFAGNLLLRVAPSSYPAYPLSMDFVQFAFPHESPVAFRNGAVLLDLTYSNSAPARGRPLTLRSFWQTPAPAEISFALRPASNLLNALPVVLAQGAQPLAAGPAQALTHTLTVPDDIPPGVYFVTLTVRADGLDVPAITGQGRERGLIHLAPLVIDHEHAGLAGESLGSFGPAIDLLAASLAPTPGGAQLNLVWHARDEAPGSYVLAVRLRDAGGLEWSGFDTQTAYGFYPTHLWRPGELVPDFYGLPLLPGAPPGDYALSLSLRDPASGANLGALDLTRALTVTTPIGDRQARHVLLSELGLAHVEFPASLQQGDAPEIRAGWLVTAAPAADYRARWTLTPAGQADGRQPVTLLLDLAPGSRPSQWPAGSYVLGRNRLGTAPTLPPGPYTLSLQLEGPDGLPVGEAVTLGPLEVTGRARVFEVPPLQVRVGATFGDALTLWGYDAAQDNDALRLTLAWGALAAPERDYKYFVHLFSQADGFVAAQADAVPRGFTYPTVLWLPGEVVTDTVSLPLAGLAPGRYGLALGWYDPAAPGLPRLPAYDSAGQPLPDNRLVLPLEIKVP